MPQSRAFVMVMTRANGRTATTAFEWHNLDCLRAALRELCIELEVKTLETDGQTKADVSDIRTLVITQVDPP